MLSCVIAIQSEVSVIPICEDMSGPHRALGNGGFALAVCLRSPTTLASGLCNRTASLSRMARLRGEEIDEPLVQ